MRSAATPTSPADEAREDYDTWLEAHDAEVAAQALRDAARRFKGEMSVVWGGDSRWLTTGTHVADLVACVLRELADEAEAGDL